MLERPVGRRLVGRHHERRPEPGRGAGGIEAFGQHADHGVLPAVHLDGGADGVRVRPEPARPHVVAQEHDRGRALLGVGRGEQPAEVRHGPQHGEVGRGHGRAREVAVRPAPYDGDARRGAELLERPGVGPQPAQLGVRERRRSRAVRPDLAHEHDRLRVGIRQGPEQQAVDRTEQGRVRTDAQREHEHHRARESRAMPQAAGRVAHVAPQVVEPPPAPDVAGALADQGTVPQPSPGRQLGFGFGDAGVLLPLKLEIQVKAQLFLEVLVRVTAAQIRYEAIHPRWPSHAHPPASSRSYSKRSVLIGSTRVARRAGSQQATSAAATSASGAGQAREAAAYSRFIAAPLRLPPAA